MKHVSVIVRGRVQGVGFRFETRAQAERMGVSGWVRNRGDGSVEALLEGEDGAVEALLAWMEHGPAGAAVDAVDSAPAGPSGATGFEIRGTS
ncbi:acylphosphatase [Microbacterium sp. NPDC096154]|uniref:acylphosphatase n=1 Tax=Microbacterium sp. NPDC096154 TaxID=3155549 RepID=UPI003322B828